MTQLTKAQLVDQLTALRVAYDRLSCENESLRTRLAATRVQHTHDTSAYRARLAEAKAQAMATGRVVQV
jgi:hypothetical protein